MEKLRDYLKNNQLLLIFVLASVAFLAYVANDLVPGAPAGTGLNLKRPAELGQHIERTKSVVVRSYPALGVEAHDLSVTFSDNSTAEYTGLTGHTFRELQERYLGKLPPEKVVLEIPEQGVDWGMAMNAGFLLLLVGFGVYAMRNNLGGTRFDMVKPEKLEDSFERLIGMEDIKEEVRQILDVTRSPEIYRSHGIERPMNMLFTGPAGTGKTRIVGVIARELGVPLLHINASNLENGFLAGGSNTLKALDRRARKLGRCVVFIDEGQTLLMKRGQSDRSMGKHADDTANTLLSILDGVDRKMAGQAIWIVATNFDDRTMSMDEAMSRRFGFKVNFRLPNLGERREMLTAFFARRADHLAPDLDLRSIAEITAGLSPALLETIADKASMLSIQEEREIDTALVMKAFERTTIGLTNRAMTAEQNHARKIVATHELGHFFTQFARLHEEGLGLDKMRGRLRVIKISTESLAKGDGGALGFVLQRQEDHPLQSRDDLEWEVIKLYGGAAAEEVFFGKHKMTTGAFQDYQQSTKILKTMISDLSMYSESKVSYAVLLDGKPTEAMIAQVESTADALYKRALAIVYSYRPLIETLRPILLDRYTLTQEEALNAIEAHTALLPPIGRVHLVADEKAPTHRTELAEGIKRAA